MANLGEDGSARGRARRGRASRGAAPGGETARLSSATLWYVDRMTSLIQRPPLVVSEKREAAIRARTELELQLAKRTLAAPPVAPRVVRPPSLRSESEGAVVRPASDLLGARRAARLLEAPSGFFVELQRLLVEMRANASHVGEPGAVRAPPDEPDIDSTNLAQIAPGWPLVVHGTDFHASRGRVLYEPSIGGPTFELVIDAWSETEIRAHLAEGVTAVGPAANGDLWVVRADGHTSNIVRVDFQPALVQYWVLLSLQFVRPMKLGRLKTYNVAAKSEPDLPWGFSIFAVTHHHAGAGTSSLDAPAAGARTWAQGYELDMPPGDAHVELRYWIHGPRGVAPPALVDDRFSDWFLVPSP